MKSEGAIRQKLKQVRFRHAKRALDTLLARHSSNCKNNASCEVPNVGVVGVCRLDPTVVCDTERNVDPSHNCMAYEPRYSKDGLKDELEGEFNAPLGEVAAKYPDAAALMWVLTDDNGAQEGAPLMDPFGESGLFVGTFFGSPLWTNTEGARVAVVRGLDDLVRSEGQARRDLQAKAREFEGAESEMQDLRLQHTRAEQELASIGAALNEVMDRVRELETALQAVSEERDALQAKLDLPFWSRWLG
jgi:hypothetical protein